MDVSQPILRVDYVTHVGSITVQWQHIALHIPPYKSSVSEALRRADGGYLERDRDYRPVTL